MIEIGEAKEAIILAKDRSSALRHIRRDLMTGGRIIVLSDPSNTVAATDASSIPFPLAGVDAQLTALVGRTVIAANGIVSAWAMLYAVI